MFSLDEAEQVERYCKWQHTASLAALLANINRNIEERPEPFTPEEFMPVSLPGEPIKPTKKQQTPEEQLEIIKMLNTALGGDFVIS